MQAERLVERLISPEGDAPDHRRALRAVDQLGDREIRATAAIAASFGDRPIHALERALADRESLARTSRELRELAAHATDRGASADATADRVRATIARLDRSREVLDVDNGRLRQQEVALWTEIQALRDFAALAAAIDERLEERIAAMEAEGATLASALREDVQYAVRRRRRDILLQLAVATQGYATLRRIEQGNLELIWMIRSMATTTTSALRIAALAAAAVREGRARDAELPGVREAWDAVVTALDRVDARRREALESMQQK